MNVYKVTAYGSCAMSVFLLILGCVLVFALRSKECGVTILNLALFFGTFAGGMGFAKLLEIGK